VEPQTGGYPDFPISFWKACPAKFSCTEFSEDRFRELRQIIKIVWEASQIHREFIAVCHTAPTTWEENLALRARGAVMVSQEHFDELAKGLATNRFSRREVLAAVSAVDPLARR
jgi:hypothetical protein